MPIPSTPSEIFQAALRRHQAGDLEGAVILYKQVLQTNPRSAQVYHMLGLISYQLQDYDNAADLMEFAIEIDSGDASFFHNLGLAHQAAGRLEEAESAIRRATELDPHRDDAWSNLGAVLEKQGNFEDAEKALRTVIERSPEDPVALNNLAGVLRARGRLEDAETVLRLAAENTSAHGEIFANLGNLLGDMGRDRDAEQAYRRAVEAAPDFWEPWCNLGALLMRQDRLEEAEQAIRRAIDPDSGHWQAYLNLGLVLQARGKPREAERALRRAARLNPESTDLKIRLADCLRAGGKKREAEALLLGLRRDHPGLATVHNGLAEVYRFKGRIDLARQAWEQAIELDPGLAEAQFGLGSLLAAIGDAHGAVRHLRKAVQSAPDLAGTHSNLLMAMQYDGSLAREDVAAEHRRWGERHGGSPEAETGRRPRAVNRRLRVGFVSASFRFHAAAFFVLPMLESRDRESWEAVLFSNVRQPDKTTEAFRCAADRWIDVSSLSDGAFAKRVVDQGIDILFDLNGHTSGNRLRAFARRLAPVQATWSDYVDTTGIEAMDYILGDPIQITPEDERHYVERVLRLPHDYICYRPPDDAPPVTPPPFEKNGFVTFGCFNTVRKLSVETIALWAPVLNRIADSRLILNSPEFRWPTVKERYEALFSDHGIDPARIEFATGGDHRNFLERYGDIDVALDPTPYSGGLNTCEALWMGVPVVTLRGDRFCGRHAAAHLTAVGLQGLIAETRADFLEIAAGLAGDPGRLAELRRGLRERVEMSPLTDPRAFTAAFTDLLRQMWRRAGSG
ncbi:MAG: tetratricopeptide repeat protein [Rhodospirillales bacterium]|nr:tetratricopeptide repeat protein [Rhodospirillales bacterium]